MLTGALFSSRFHFLYYIYLYPAYYFEDTYQPIYIFRCIIDISLCYITIAVWNLCSCTGFKKSVAFEMLYSPIPGVWNEVSIGYFLPLKAIFFVTSYKKGS